MGDEFATPTAEELNALLPQFRVEAELGRGGMGVVYRGIQLNLDRPVAIKLLAPHLAADSAFAERFAREARALARLSHPNIVAVYDFGQAGSFFYLVMELVNGANLRHVMYGGHIEPKQALEVVSQICDALQYAHNEGFVHRDIKPENILLDKRGRVKIADFGLAKLLGKAPSDVSLTATQEVMGTLHYMAPEQIEGTKTLDHRADIYSLGVVFYELLTGELPIGRFAPSKKVEIDVRLDEVVLRALEKEPEQRYQHASEVKTDMETIAGRPAKAAETMKLPSGNANNASFLGRISLWTAIGGLVLPILLALIGSLLASVVHPSEAYFMLCFALLLVLELAAFGCGIVGRRTTSGKAGLAVSVISLTLVSFVVLILTPLHTQSSPSSIQNEGIETSRPTIVEDTPMSGQSDGPANTRPKTTSAPATPPVQKPLAANTHDYSAPRFAGKRVAATAEELSHVLSELPKEFTKGLLGDDKQNIKELNTMIWAIDFDDGPAEFWLIAHEKGQETFRCACRRAMRRQPGGFPRPRPTS